MYPRVLRGQHIPPDKFRRFVGTVPRWNRRVCYGMVDNHRGNASPPTRLYRPTIDFYTPQILSVGFVLSFDPKGFDLNEAFALLR